MTILIRRTKNDPTSAFRAFPDNVEIAKDKEIAVLIHTKRRMIISPGLIETISRRKMAVMMSKIMIERLAERRNQYTAPGNRSMISTRSSSCQRPKNSRLKDLHHDKYAR